MVLKTSWLVWYIEFAAGMFRLTNKVFVSQPNDVIYDVIRQGCRRQEGGSWISPYTTMSLGLVQAEIRTGNIKLICVLFRPYSAMEYAKI